MKLLSVILFLFQGSVAFGQFLFQHTWVSRGIQVPYISFNGGTVSPEYLAKHKIDSLSTLYRECHKGKVSKVVFSSSHVLYDSTGSQKEVSGFRHGKMTYHGRYQRTSVPNGLEFKEWQWGRKFRFRYAKQMRIDTVFRVDSSWYKPSMHTNWYLLSVNRKNESGRWLNYIYFNSKGKETYKGFYVYDSSGRLMQIRQFNKGKYHITDFSCAPLPDTLKRSAYDTQCKRTDKDPMGNILEIVEQKRGKQIYILTKKFSPDRSRLLEVSTVYHGRPIRVVYDYDPQERLSNVRYFYKSMEKPYYEIKYYYVEELPCRAESFMKGRMRMVIEYRLRKKV
jgi:hypothetical protein